MEDMASEDVDRLFTQIQEETDIFIKAKLLKKLQKEEDVPLKDIAEALGQKPAYICHVMRLNRVPEIIVDGYYSQLISLSHLFILSRVKDPDIMVEIYEQVLADSKTALQTEKLVREHLHGVKTEGDYLPRQEKEKYQFTSDKGTTHISVDIQQSRIKTTLKVEMKGSMKNTNEILRRLMAKIKEWKAEENL